MAHTSFPSSVAYQPLHDLAASFLQEWQRTHGRACQEALAELNGDLLTMTIHNALTDSELRMAQTASGRELVKRYIIRLVNDLYPRLAQQVEGRLGCFVTASDVEVEVQTGSVRMRVGLRDVGRLPAMLEPVVASVSSGVKTAPAA